MNEAGVDAMTIDELRAMKKAEPFRPFVIRLKDGRKFEVPTTDYFSPSPNPGGQRFVVWKNKAFHFFDLSMISDIEFKTVKARRNRRAS